MLIVGLGGSTSHGCVALSDGTRVIGVCEQERVTRVLGAGFNASGLPDEALDTLLERSGHTRADVARYVAAEVRPGAGGRSAMESIDHHLAHAATAYLSSPFSSAIIVICDREAPGVSVWSGRGGEIVRVDWPWSGQGLGDLYSQCAAVFGFGSAGGEQRLEAMARLSPESRDERLNRLLRTDGHAVVAEPNWQADISSWMSLGQGSVADSTNAKAAAAKK